MKSLLQNSLVVGCLAGCVLAAYGTGRAYHLQGTIVAYDPTYHSLKQASFVKNLEVTVADVGKTRDHPAFVKLVFEGFGREQVAEDVLSGKRSFKIQAVRDTSCDEGHPHVLSDDVDSFQGSGAFILNQSHRTEPLNGVSHLECYRTNVNRGQ
jgi:hypothetical protein